jgi:spore germination cell wall hydrolase CwlJ-like protein
MIFETALLCLALNVYHEARNQPTIGQIAVAQVVMNRVEDARYPNDVCEVVRQGKHYLSGHPVKNQCQFSWYCDGKSDAMRNLAAAERAYEIAEFVLDGSAYGMLDGATHYHTDKVLPTWASYKTFIVKINDHIFYRWD